MSSDAGPSRVQLLAFWHDQHVVFDLPQKEAVTVGRAKDNDVCIEHPSVSRQHARFILGDPLVIEDLGGTNGTFVRGSDSRVSAEQTQRLRQLAGTRSEIAIGDTVVLGAVTVVIRRSPGEISSFPDVDADATAPPSQVVLLASSMRTIYRQARSAAASTLSVMILGETGVGKEVLARYVHARSPRAQAAFREINCATLSGTLLEDELFGHARGAFSGALQARAGVLEDAHGGTVFLDEVGEASLDVQAKLLRVIEEKVVKRLGENQPRSIDVRFVTATNRNLEDEVGAGRFRQDLYYRLNGIGLVIPPLRDRPEEIEPLTRTFLETVCRELNRPRLSISREALQALSRHRWPGNVRELRNAIERAVVLCQEGSILTEHLPPAVLEKASGLGQASPGASGAGASGSSMLEPERYEAERKALERRRIQEALEQCGGNQTKAAELLKMPRRTLVAKIRAHNLPRPRKGRDEES